MKLIEVGGSKVKRTFLNLAAMTKVDLLENGNIELTGAGFFDVIPPEDQGYQEIIKELRSKQ